jgi:hypothetical protein
MPAADFSSRTYTHRPKPFSSDLRLSLTAGELIVERARSRKSVPLHEIERIRLCFAPQNTVTRCFACEVQGRNGREALFHNVTWNSLIDAQKQDQAYRDFVLALIERTSQAHAGRNQAATILEAGIAPLRYRLMQISSLAMVAALLATALSSARSSHATIAILSLGMAAYLGHWSWNYLSRNRPHHFNAGDPPEAVLPEPEGTNR